MGKRLIICVCWGRRGREAVLRRGRCVNHAFVCVFVVIGREMAERRPLDHRLLLPFVDLGLVAIALDALDHLW